MTINTNINVSDYRLFVEPIEFSQFFVLWPCFQLPHVFRSPIKISLKRKGKETLHLFISCRPVCFEAFPTSQWELTEEEGFKQK